ncbi:MAG TPA: SH3 domain-containing protein [Kofleriaceae bacterium]|nr:SH3 domain-containing protein [Kofleriaceae bacterium]
MAKTGPAEQLAQGPTQGAAPASSAHALAAGGRRDPDTYAAALQANPSAVREIMAFLHQTFGSAFVRTVMALVAPDRAANDGAAHGPMRVTVNGLNVRSTPDRTGNDNVVGLLHHHAIVDASGRQGDWVRIEHGGKHAFVFGEYVEPAARPAPAAHAEHSPSPAVGHAEHAPSPAVGHAERAPAHPPAAPVKPDVRAHAPDPAHVAAPAAAEHAAHAENKAAAPKEVKEAKKARPHGFTKYGGGTVRAALTRLANAGKLSITGNQIAQLDALAQVETGGQVSGVDTTDDMVVSIGFHQVVLGHKSIEAVMQKAPAAFAKHGLELDMSATYKVKGWSNPHQIKGAADVEDLRGHDWGDRFYAASLEDDVIVAIAQFALDEARAVETITTASGGTGDYFADDTARAWILEVHNNRPAYTAEAVRRAVEAGAKSAKNRDQFLDILSAAIVDTYGEREAMLFYQREKARPANQHITAEKDAELREHAKTTYGRIGRTKGTHIVTKISRHLDVPRLDAPTVAAGKSPAPAAPASSAPIAEHATASPAHHDAPAPAHHDAAAPAHGAPAQAHHDAPSPAQAHHDAPTPSHGAPAHGAPAQTPHNAPAPAHHDAPASGHEDDSSLAQHASPAPAHRDAPAPTHAAPAPAPKPAPVAAGHATDGAASSRGTDPALAAHPAQSPAVAGASRTPGEHEFETANHNIIARTTTEEATVLNNLRKEPRRFDPAWLLTAQTNLGVVDATGAMNTETLRAMRARSGNARLDAHAIMTDAGFLAQLAPGEPFFAGSETGAHAHKAPSPGATSNKDRTVQELGYADFNDYRAQWGNDNVRFMGHDFGSPAHPYLRARLKVAEAYLHQRIKGPGGEKLDDQHIARQLGWNTSGKETFGNASYHHAAANPYTHQHAMGLAIDIQPAQNVYLFESASGWMTYFEKLSVYAHKMFGGEILHPATLLEWSKQMSTEELYQKVQSGSDSFSRLLAYSRQLNKNERDPDLLAKIAAMGYKAQEARTVAHQIALADEDFHLQEGRRNASGVMNMNQEMLIALRDVAGLAWGGAEIAAGENGDMMHFDCRLTDFGSSMYHAGYRHKPSH